jgi:hypothetical protein
MAANKAWSGAGHPDNEMLGAGAIYFNYGLANEFLLGVTKGGNEFNDNAEFRDREGDSDFAPVKGARDLSVLRPQLTVRSLRIDVQNFLRYYAGLKADSGGAVAGVLSLYRTVDLSASYITNVAWVGQDRAGNNMAIIVKNALGDCPLNIVANKAEEVVPEIIFTGHIDPLTFDPSDESTYPYEIQFEVAALTITVMDNAGTPAPVVGATVKLDDGQVGTTNETGVAMFDVTFGKIGYTITKTGFITGTGVITVDSATETATITLVTST